jgi:DNA segregation ATPase FtsK/SpoIIIE, S-DNA-T family
VAKASTKSGPGSGRLSGVGDSARKVGRSAPHPRSVGRRRRRSSLYGTARGLVFRRETIGVALVVAAVVAIPWLVPITTGLSDPRDGVVQALGLYVFLLIALIALVGWLILRRSLVFSFQYYWRVWLAGLLLAAFTDGLLGLIRPGWRLGGTTLSAVTAGGDWGHALVGSPVGVLVWLVLAVAAVSVIWPRRTLEAVRRSPRLAVVVWRWRLPQRTWRLLHVIVEALFPTKAEPEPPQPLSTETLTWARTAGTATDETTAPASAAGEGGEAAAAVEEPWQPTLPLEMAPAQEEEQPTPPWGPSGEGWQTPSLDVLVAAGPEASERPDSAARARLIVDTLASFGVDSEVVQINEGPTVTQFGVEPGWEIKTRTIQERDSAGRPVFDRNGHPKVKTEEVSRTRVRVNQITSLANDLALALATPSIRIEAPVPGQPVVGIEVPNVTTSLVTLRSVIESTAFQRLAARSKLALALGKSVSGEPVVGDLAKMPHLLIAGATGSGKSVCINSIITCLLMHGTPDEVRLVMIDPKRVELAAFARIPHLAFSSIVIDVDKVVGTLQAVIHEMESRYRRFASLAVRNIEAYNKHPRSPGKLPYWVVIIDELADLMMAAPYEVERQVCRLAQLARATGIHLIIATQRPSVDVVTGLIKANFPTRIAFAVSSQVDSRTILDGGGAEKLLGRGDMLYQPTDAAKPKRLQGVYVSDPEIERLVGFWTQERFRDMQRHLYDHLMEEARPEVDELFGVDDPLFERAKELAMEHSRMSTSMLQRRLRVGYPRAARLMDMLEEKGVVGESEGGSSRKVLVQEEDEDES